MNTTLKKIKAEGPCQRGWEKLLKGLGKTEADDEVLPLSRILGINCLEDALWALRAVENHDREIRLFAVWCASQGSDKLTNDSSFRAIEVAEAFARGQASKEELDEAWEAASFIMARSVAMGVSMSEAWFAARNAAKSAAREAASYAVSDEARYEAREAAFEATRNSQAQEFLRVCAEIEVGRDPYPNKIFNRS